MEIRLAQWGDLEAVVAIDPIAEHDAARKVLLKSSIGDRECWIAVASGAVAGFVILTYSFYGNGFVPLLVVHASLRRRGTGRQLLDQAVSICETPKLFTSTNESNAAMRSLLGGAGFEPAGVIYHLDPGDAELVYVRQRVELGARDREDPPIC